MSLRRINEYSITNGNLSLLRKTGSLFLVPTLYHLVCTNGDERGLWYKFSFIAL